MTDLYEIPHSSLCIGPEIGEGAFGRVFKAIVKDICNDNEGLVVAVKQLKRKFYTVNIVSDTFHKFFFQMLNLIATFIIFYTSHRILIS